MTERLFRGAVPFYVRYRPTYPQALLDQLAERCRLDGSGRLLDLGCGPGLLALALAPRFGEVIGMDPEPEMLEAARASAAEAGIGNVRWIEGASTDLGPDLAPLRLTTMGRSFHWMDRPATLDALFDLTEAGGAIAILGETHDHAGANDWREAMRRVCDGWSGRGNPRAARRCTHKDHFVVVARSRFPRREVVRVPQEREWSLDDIVGLAHSMSFCSPAHLGDRLAAFESELRRTLSALSPDGRFVERAEAEAILAFKD